MASGLLAVFYLCIPALIGVCFLALLYMRLETTLLRTSRLIFAKSGSGLTVLQLSDIHINRCYVSPEKVADVVKREKPDVILLTGDYIEFPEDVPVFLDFISRALVGRKAYACLGNHDLKAFIGNPQGLREFCKSLEALGVEVLNNRTVCYEKNGKAYNITGLSQAGHRPRQLEKAFAGANPNAFMSIAISHNPDAVLNLPGNRVDYLFCGHFHGGQIWTPFGLEFKLLRHERLCKRGIRRGLHRVNGVNLYINRGLGNVLLPLRFLSYPEAAVFLLP